MVKSGKATGIREIENLTIPLRDGTRLAARVFLPIDAERHSVPAILECVPYGKRFGTSERDESLHPAYAANRYAAVRLDLRGSGESEGLLNDEYTSQEQDDCVEVIEWLARQTWCTGAVGLMGISWGGFNALQVAARRPPPLKAIITVCSSDDRYRDDAHYMGGAVLLEGFVWNATLMMSVTQPPDPALIGERWRALWMQRLENVPLFLKEWLCHRSRDEYWRHGSVSENLPAIACPVYAVGGWTDAYRNGIGRLLSGLRVPRKGLIGPWAHRYPHMGLPGPAIDFLNESLRWWDKWLWGTETGVMDGPMLRAWMLESVHPVPHHAARPGRWVAEPIWPPPKHRELRLYLNEARLGKEVGRVVPFNLCSPECLGARAGSWCPFGVGPDDADDQREDDACSLVFESPPLADRLELLGTPVLNLELACNRPFGTIIARLCDVRPNGASLRLTYGVLDLTYRGGYDEAAPPQPGHRYVVRVALNDIAFAFPAGHRIRLALSTAYWPIVWPKPQRPVVTVFAGASTLLLPARPRQPIDDELQPLPPPKTGRPNDTTAVTAAHTWRREVGRRSDDGEAFCRVVREPIAVRIDQIGAELTSAAFTEFKIRDDDPLSAHAFTRHQRSFRRADWHVRVELEATLTAGSDAFTMRGQLRAFERDRAVCERGWQESVPRSGGK